MHFVIPTGIPPAQNTRSSAQGSWMVRSVLFLIFVIRCRNKSLEICPHVGPQSNTIGPKSCHNCVSERSWRGPGSSLGAFGGPSPIQHRIYIRFPWIWDNFVVCFSRMYDQESDVLSNMFFNSVFSWFWERFVWIIG